MFRHIAISLLLATLASAAGARTRPQYGGVLRVETQRDLWQGDDAIGRRLTMDGLTALDASGTVRPALATQWSSQSADHHWEFRLRAGVTFHDGTPLTAEVVVASMSASCSDACPWKTLHAVGSSVVFTGDSPMADLPEELARAQFLISHRNADGITEGTGPFSYSATPNNSASGGSATFIANDDCWSGRPFLDAVEVRAKRSIRDQWMDLGIGRADLVEVPPPLVKTAQQQHLIVVSTGPVDLLALQVSSTGSLSNEKLRQAISLAVDRSALYNVIFQKQGEVTASVLPGNTSGYAFLFSTDRNLDRAAELRGGATPAQITLAPENTSPELQLTAERLALNLRESGFRVTVLSSNDIGRADIVLRRVHLEAGGPQAALTEVLEKFGGSATVSGSDAESIYNAERDFLAKYTFVPLLFLPRAYAVSERVRDLRLTADGTPLLGDAALRNANGSPGEATGETQ